MDDTTTTVARSATRPGRIRSVNETKPHAELVLLADRYWQEHLRDDPLKATEVGDRRFDDRLPDIRPEAVARRRQGLAGLAASVAGIKPEELDESGLATRDALLQVIDGDLATIDADLLRHTVSPASGPQVAFLNLADYQPVDTADARQAMVARWRAMGPWVDELIANLERGRREGALGVRKLVERSTAELEELLAQPDEAWPLVSPAEKPSMEADERARFRDDLLSALAESVRPAFRRYRDFLHDAIAPVARDDDHPGLAQLPGGEAAYAALARVHTTTQLTPEQIHEIGLREIERIDEELRSLGERQLKTSSLSETLERLRGDAALHFATRDEVAEAARVSLDRANAAVPAWFRRLPSQPCEVVRMLPHEEEHSTIAYYRDPAMDASRPGRYYVNTSAPETRPRYEAEALAFHESVPGHHLQVALAQELADLPAFRRHGTVTAYVEGWGLYAERLADEMGLYSGPLDRFGIASFDAWRASRLVVDTGMHALGWTRNQAIGFMVEHTALGSNNIANEVDRYIAWPGQALAYKIGQLELLRLRAEAKGRLGERFDIRTFHDAVLSAGPVPLATLRGIVERQLA
jgi:uncharacterized protein (DUF885 family)